MPVHDQRRVPPDYGILRDSPSGVVRWIHPNDDLSELEHPLALLTTLNDPSEIIRGILIYPHNASVKASAKSRVEREVSCRWLEMCERPPKCPGLTFGGVKDGCDRVDTLVLRYRRNIDPILSLRVEHWPFVHVFEDLGHGGRRERSYMYPNVRLK